MKHLPLPTVGLLSSLDTLIFSVLHALSSPSLPNSLLSCPSARLSVISPSLCSSDGSSFVWNPLSPRNRGNHVSRWLMFFKAAFLMLPWDRRLYQLSMYLSISVFVVAHDHMLTDIHQAIFCCLPSPFLSHLSSASIPFFACELKAVTPYKRGFFCGDTSITYPYVPSEAIPDSLLIAGGIAITGLTVRK